VVTGPQGVQAGPLGVTRRSGDVTERVERRRRAQQHSPDPDLHSHPRTDDVTSPSQAARPTGTFPVTGSRQSPLSCRTVIIHHARSAPPMCRSGRSTHASPRSRWSSQDHTRQLRPSRAEYQPAHITAPSHLSGAPPSYTNRQQPVAPRSTEKASEYRTRFTTL
jgi:hypothetical protein